MTLPSNVEDYSSRYSRKNLPPTKGDAFSRLDILEESITGINAQLNHYKPSDYASDDEFYSWRSKAVAALAYNQRERMFLERWIVNLFAPFKHSQSDYVNIHACHEELLERACARATQLAHEIGGNYTSQPTNRGKQRVRHLNAIFHKLRQAWLQSDSLSKALSFSDGEAIRVKESLLEIFHEVEKELDIVNNPPRKS